MRLWRAVTLCGPVLVAGAWSSTAHGQDPNACAAAAEQGQVLHGDHKLLAARQQLLRCVVEACPKVVRDDCIDRLSRVDDATPSLAIHAKDTRGQDVIGARVLLDGVQVSARLDGTALRVDPGPHRVRLETASGASADLDVLAAEGQKGRVVEITFAEALTADGRKVGDASNDGARGGGGPGWPALSYVLLGAGVVSLGLGTYFELAGQSAYRDLRDGCATSHSCAEGDVDAAKLKLYVLAPVTLGLGAALIAGGAFVVLSRGPASARAGLAPAPGGAVGSLRVSF